MQTQPASFSALLVAWSAGYAVSLVVCFMVFGLLTCSRVLSILPFRTVLLFFFVCVISVLSPSEAQAVTALVGLCAVVFTHKYEVKEVAEVVIIAWGALLVFLRPILLGNSLGHAIVGPLRALVPLAVVLVALGAVALSLSPLVKSGVRCYLSLVLVLLRVVIGVALAYLSSIFLIRLWGFHTLDYLQTIVLVLQIVLFAGLFLQLVFRFSTLTERHLFIAVLPLALLGSTLLFIASSHIPKRDLSFVTNNLPHTSLVLSKFRDYLDGDGDRYSAQFGGGDCNDSLEQENPKARDVPNNGSDENCLGGDVTDIFHGYFSHAHTRDYQLPRRETPTKRKVVIFLAIDTLRNDYLSPEFAPVLSSLAERSLVFENARSPSNNSLEAFPFLLQAGSVGHKAESALTLATLLRGAGIDTYGLFQGGAPIWWSKAIDSVFFDFNLVDRPSGHGMAPVKDLFEQVTRRLMNDSPRDQFAFIHVSDLHDSFIRSFDGARVAFGGANLSELLFFSFNTNEAAEKMSTIYKNELQRIDEQIPVLLNLVAELEGRGDEVMFIVTSDHGEEFAEHGGFFHMGTLFDELLRVPLVIYQTGKGPQRTSEPIGLYRLPATVLDYFGFSGRAVTPVSLTKHVGSLSGIFSVFSLQRDDFKRVFSLVQDDHKLIYHTYLGTFELYDLKADPMERYNLTYKPEKQDLLSRLKRELDVVLYHLHN